MYKNLVEAVKEDQDLYELMALIDTLRIGKAREINLATDKLRKKFKLEQPV